jgi:TLC domain
VLPSLGRDTLCFTVAFLLLQLVLTAVFRARGAEAKTARGGAAALSASLHHVYAVYIALAALRHELVAYTVPAAFILAIAPITLAYLSADFLVTAVPDALGGNYEYLLHHGMGLLIVILSLQAPLALVRWSPHLLLCEASTIFLSLGWALRKVGMESSPLTSFVNYIFVLIFFITRIVNLPIVFFHIVFLHRDDAVSAGAAVCAMFLGLVVMQFYWFTKILHKVLRVSPPRKGAPKGEKPA